MHPFRIDGDKNDEHYTIGVKEKCFIDLTELSESQIKLSCTGLLIL